MTERSDMMRIDLRIHPGIRAQVRDGLIALRLQGRQIWGDLRHDDLEGVVCRLMVGVGDLARLARDSSDGYPTDEAFHASVRERKKELGNILFSIVRWIDDLGLDPLECLTLAIEAQEKFAQSGRPR